LLWNFDARLRFAQMEPNKRFNYFTSDEVAKHNKPKDLWVIMNRKVYDVSQFYKFHPGGPDILLHYAGKDATTPASAAHKTTIPSNVMKEFEIGYVKMAKENSKKPVQDTGNTIPVVQMPKPQEKHSVPLREKAKGGADNAVKSKKETSQYDYGQRIMEGCPKFGNESGTFKELRSVNKLAGRTAEFDRKEAAEKEKVEKESRDKEMADLNNVTAHVMKVTVEDRNYRSPSNEKTPDQSHIMTMVERQARQRAEEEGLVELQQDRVEQEAARAAEMAAQITQNTFDREKKLREDEMAMDRQERDRVRLEKLLREAREKADHEWWDQKAKEEGHPPVQQNGGRHGAAMNDSVWRQPSDGSPHRASVGARAKASGALRLRVATENTSPTNGERSLMAADRPPAERTLDAKAAPAAPYPASAPAAAKATVATEKAHASAPSPGLAPASAPAAAKATVAAEKAPASPLLRAPQDIIPGGFKMGEMVYWMGGQQRLSSGNVVAFGLQGKVIGRGNNEKRVQVKFDGNDTTMDVTVTQICRDHPVIPGGYECGDEVFYAGEKEVFSNGDELCFGLKGGVQGRSCIGDASDEKRLKCLFAGHKSSVSVFLSQICREMPDLPGGYQVGDIVYYTGKKNQQLTNDDRLIIGNQGTITARSSMGDSSDDRRVKVRFEGNKGPVNVFVAEISSTLNPSTWDGFKPPE